MADSWPTACCPKYLNTFHWGRAQKSVTPLDSSDPRDTQTGRGFAGTVHLGRSTQDHMGLKIARIIITTISVVVVYAPIYDINYRF